MKGLYMKVMPEIKKFEDKILEFEVKTLQFEEIVQQFDKNLSIKADKQKIQLLD